jgi:hypothetical protein
VVRDTDDGWKPSKDIQVEFAVDPGTLDWADADPVQKWLLENRIFSISLVDANGTSRFKLETTDPPNWRTNYEAWTQYLTSRGAVADSFIGWPSAHSLPVVLGVFSNADELGVEIESWDSANLNTWGEEFLTGDLLSDNPRARAVAVDSGMLSGLGDPDPTDEPVNLFNMKAHPVSGPDPTCHGLCNQPGSPLTQTLYCSMAFEGADEAVAEPYPHTRYRPGNALGVLGAPLAADGQRKLADPQHITGIGTLGLACDNWQKSPSYYERWSVLQTVKAVADDTLDGVLKAQKVVRLMHANQDHFVTFTNPNPTSSTLDAHFRPLPLKLCPSNSVMTGFKYHSSGDLIAGIDAIRCTYEANASSSSWEPLFSSDGRHDQYVGRPTNVEKHQATCASGKVIAGMEVHRATTNGRVTGFRLVCQDSFF